MDYRDLKRLVADKDKWHEICNLTSFLDQSYSKIPARQRIWHIENNDFSLASCLSCGKPGIGFNEKNKTYSRYCNSTCAQQDIKIRIKTEETCNRKYGVKSNLCLKQNKEKEEATKLKRYGVKSYNQTEEFKKKYRETCLKRYGTDNASKSQIVKDKINSTNLVKYGRKRSSQLHIPINVIDLKNNEQEMRRWFYDLKMPVTEIANILQINHSQLCIHFKENLGIDISRHNVSSFERQFANFLTELGIKDIVTSDRTLLKPKEIDILIPSKKLAIEINGLAWHSESRGKDKLYHLRKSELCNEQGYRLIHIWSTEWENQRELVESRIKSILGLNQSIMARKCQIVSNLTANDANDFLNKNHIQGYCPSKIRLGLLYDGEIVGVMTFGQSRFNKSIEWELLRYCTKQGVNIVGGPSKLFSNFVRDYNPKSIVSYSDRRWNTGKLYSTLGFTFVKNSDPNFWYTKRYTELESRLRYQKHKLLMVLPIFNPELTASDNMRLNGYDKVWDCGSSIWHWARC